MTQYPIPDSALDSDIAILGRKGGGKTFTAKGIVERLLDHGRRVLVLDPLGVWAGLRTGADGESPGYPVAIFGGLHADMPLDTAAAKPMAAIITRENVPAVIDLSELSKHAQQSFLLVFLHELRRANTEALTIVLEEADVFAPQNPLGDDSKALHGEIDWIARRGRSRGFRLITITQRPARLSKDVLTQCATLIAHRLPAPQDRDAVKAWVDGNGDKELARSVFDTLAQLQVGEAWVYASEEGTLARQKFPAIKTLDTSATPKAGQQRIEPKTLAQVDVTAIREALQAAQQAAGQAAPGTSSKTPQVAQPDPAALAAAEQRGYERGFRAGRAEGHVEAGKAVTDALAAFIAGQKGNLTVPSALPHEPIATPTRSRSAPKVTNGSVDINSAARKLLAILDTNPPIRRSWAQVATLAGLKARGGHFNAGRKGLVESGLVIDEGGLVRVAQPSAGAAPETGDPAALVRMWQGALSGAAPKVLGILFRSKPMHKEAVAAALEMQPRGGHWNAAWKELRDNGLVEEISGTWRLTELLR